MKFRIYVSDTVTYERSQVVEIEAADEIAARAEAIDMALAGELHASWEEVEIDNTPYDAVVADPEHA